VAARIKKRKEVDYTSNSDPTAAGPSIKRGKKNGKVADPANSTVTESSSAQGPPPPSRNTAVFVSGLPPDTTHAELAARFGKFGVLMEDDKGNPKIKLYADDNGVFNGEALVVYFIEDSVDLAIRMLDEAELRFGEPGTAMRVKKGEFGHKGASGGKSSEQRTVKRTVDKKKATARYNKMKKYVCAPTLPSYPSLMSLAPQQANRLGLIR
jgi:HIV Tat-specific factor 1